MLTRTSSEVRKAVDEATESARLRFEKLVNSIDGIVWEADPESFRFTFVSEQAGRILGYALEEWQVDGFWEAHLHPEDRALAIEHCVSWTTHAANRCFEYRMLAKDGRVVWLKDLISVEMHDGRPVSLQGIMVDISERKRLGNALQTVMDNIPCGISLIDADLNIVLANALGRSILDVPPALFEGEKTPLEKIFRFNAQRGEYGPGDPEEQVRERLNLVRRGEPHVLQRTRPDGTVIEIRGQPLPGGGFVTVYMDVTNEKSARTALARESASIKAVLEHLPQGISVFDETLKLRHWNAGMVDVLGLPKDIVRDGAFFDDLVRIPAQRGEYGEGDPEAHVARFHELAMQFRPHQFERTRPNGKTHLVSGKPMLVNDELTGFITTYTDISERKRAEDELRLSAKVFENSTQGISITDPSGRILKVNRAFSAITGYSEEEVVGKTHAILHSGRQDQQFYRAMWKTLAEEGAWSGEMWNRRKCGELYVEQLTITRVPDSTGVTTNFIGIFSDVSQAKAAQNEIERLSMYDAMTGLPNRAFLYERLEHAMRMAERDGNRVALLAVDLDRLAHINEVLGHHTGDRLLVAVAERLNDAMRSADTVTRHIGDEFVIIMEALSDPQDAAILAERVLGELSRPFVVEGHEINISACIGIGVYPEDGSTTQVLIKHADVALHHAKETGESNFQFFREEMNSASVERLLIESNLRLALQRNEFHLVYQPQVDLSTGMITGMEVLLRWLHPQMGMVSPARFIPVAEETGHIIEIGLWVLREACRQTQCWHEQGFAGLQVAVNVSARQFRQDDFADQVRQVLEETGLAPDCLELELTESMIMQRPERVVAVMSELRALGVKFSIDDFGTGYSSLSQLKRFPIDKLKIDQSFTRDIGTDANGTAITCAIIALGNSLRLRVVAEGVETHDQQRFLVDNGCHSMQGYLFSRPVAANDFHGLLLLQRLQAAV
ncbi:EAL domain-containing protein [Noviherbaspirillum sp. ST9]|uniref:EAL domain-containing protein n=1 Tax=Noviherbaspirillum sp. ST9 TaxID=3401606 RepID=UPI003B5887FE